MYTSSIHRLNFVSFEYFLLYTKYARTTIGFFSFHASPIKHKKIKREFILHTSGFITRRITLEKILYIGNTNIITVVKRKFIIIKRESR